MKTYIKINEENRVISYSKSSSPVTEDDFFEVQYKDDKVLLGSLYIPESGMFEFDSTYYEINSEVESPIDETVYSIKQATDYIQGILDSKAKEFGYDSIISASTYVSSSNQKFRAEAISFVEWRDSVWEFAYSLLQSIKSGETEKPTLEDLGSLLPKFSVQYFSQEEQPTATGPTSP